MYILLLLGVGAPAPGADAVGRQPGYRAVSYRAIVLSGECGWAVGAAILRWVPGACYRVSRAPSCYRSGGAVTRWLSVMGAIVL